MVRARNPAAELVAEIATLLIFFLVAVGLQALSGTFSSELAHYPDEGAHYITGLMVRDYLTSGFPESPIRFAEEFYARFPKVAFGVWPPLFHLTLGLWLLPTPDGRTSVFLLMAVIMAATAYILYRSVREVAGRVSGIIIGLLLIVLPLSQAMTSTVMADTLVMLMVLATAVVLAKWLKTGSNRDAVWIGVFGGMALMSKGNGLAVALAIPLAIVLARRFNLLRKPGIYVAGAIGGALGLPWELKSLQLFRQVSSFHSFTIAGVREAFGYYLSSIFHTLGWFLCALIVLGLVACAGSIQRRDGAWNLWTSMGASAFSVIAFHVLVPQPVEERYMLAGIAPLLVFLIPSAWKIKEVLRFARWERLQRVPVILTGILAIFLLFFFGVPWMRPFGFHQVVTWLEEHPLAGERYLISDAEGEGAFISEVASRTNRELSGPRIMRASKLLFVSDWNGYGYKLIYDTPEKAMADIQAMGISYVVVDSTKNLGRAPHWEQVRWLEHDSSGRLQLVRRFPAAKGGALRSLDIYRVFDYANPPSKKFCFQTIYTRGGSIGE